jgi:hypothetical protein
MIKPISATDGKRIRNVFPCYYCEKYIYEFARHLYQCHSTEKEVMSVMFKSVGQRKATFDFLRNHAIFRHNTRVLERGSGELIVRRRSTSVRKAQDYLPCPYCLEFLVTDELWRHCQRCPLSPKPGDSQTLAEDDDSLHTKRERGLIAASRILLEGACSQTTTCTTEFNENILSRLRRDYVSRVIRSDELILQFGQSLYRKLGTHRATDICQRMRQLARLVITANSLNNKSLQLKSYIDGCHFDDILNATEKLSGATTDDNGRNIFNTPSFGLKLGHALVKCANLKKREAIKTVDIAMEKEADRFLAMHKSDWLAYVSSRSTNSLKIKRQNQPEQLPLTEDLLKLKDFLDRNISCTTLTVSEKYSYDRWRYLLELTLASVVIFNKRRGGEASKMLLTAYVNRPDWTQRGSGEIIKSLTDIERKLLKRLLCIMYLVLKASYC